MDSRVERDFENKWEYRLVASPGKEVLARVAALNDVLTTAYGQRISVKSEPVILVANFVADEAMEETVIRWIQRVCGQFPGFNVSFNNFGGFPSQLIYLRIQDAEPFRQLAERLKVIDQYLQSNGCPSANFRTLPHMPIARAIDFATFNEAMIEIGGKTFHESFSVGELILLKRKNQFEKCKQVNVFRFYPPDTHMYHQVA